MNVQTSNTISAITLNTAMESGACALAAVAIATPVGPLGGALFGAVSYLSRYPLAIFGINCLNANSPQASSAAKTLAKALIFFGSYAAAWAGLAAVGLTLTLVHTITLIAVSYATLFLVEIAMDCLGMNPRTEPVRV